MDSLALLAITLILILVFWFGIGVRIVRRHWHFPIPHTVEKFIDNPLRRRVQPPRQVVDWIALEGGMQVLEVGPGSGAFTLEAARRLGPSGRLYAVDIQPEAISRLVKRLEREGVANVTTRVASAYELPFPDNMFDAAFMVAVLAEIPDRGRALREIRRVLKDGGILAVGELVLDPDYPRRETVIQWCERGGYSLLDAKGGFVHYVVRFRKGV